MKPREPSIVVKKPDQEKNSASGSSPSESNSKTEDDYGKQRADDGTRKPKINVKKPEHPGPLLKSPKNGAKNSKSGFSSFAFPIACLGLLVSFFILWAGELGTIFIQCQKTMDPWLIAYAIGYFGVFLSVLLFTIIIFKAYYSLEEAQILRSEFRKKRKQELNTFDNLFEAYLEKNGLTEESLKKAEVELLQEIHKIAVDTGILTAFSQNRFLDSGIMLAKCYQIIQRVATVYGTKPTIRMFSRVFWNSLASGFLNEVSGLYEIVAEGALQAIPYAGKALGDITRISLEAYFNYAIILSFSKVAIKECRPMPIDNELEAKMQELMKMNMSGALRKRIINIWGNQEKNLNKQSVPEPEEAS